MCIALLLKLIRKRLYCQRAPQTTIDPNVLHEYVLENFLLNDLKAMGPSNVYADSRF